MKTILLTTSIVTLPAGITTLVDKLNAEQRDLDKRKHDANEMKEWMENAQSLTVKLDFDKYFMKTEAKEWCAKTNENDKCLAAFNKQYEANGTPEGFEAWMSKLSGGTSW